MKRSWLGYVGDYTTQLYRDSFVNHYKDTYKPTMIQWKVGPFFFSWLSYMLIRFSFLVRFLPPGPHLRCLLLGHPVCPLEMWMWRLLGSSDVVEVGEAICRCWTPQKKLYIYIYDICIYTLGPQNHEKYSKSFNPLKYGLYIHTHEGCGGSHCMYIYIYIIL